MNNEWSSKDDYITEMVHMYSDMVLRLAMTYLKNMADAEDVCQDVFIKIYKQNKLFNDAEHEKYWIIRVTINTCKDVMRSPWKKRFSPLNDDLLLIKDETEKDVVSLVLNLPKQYGVVIYLYYYEGYSSIEVANLLGRNENTVRTQLKRAKELLKTNILGGFDNE